MIRPSENHGWQLRHSARSVCVAPFAPRHAPESDGAPPFLHLLRAPPFLHSRPCTFFVHLRFRTPVRAPPSLHLLRAPPSLHLLRAPSSCTSVRAPPLVRLARARRSTDLAVGFVFSYRVPCAAWEPCWKPARGPQGAPGLVKAVKRVWPRAYRQRCQVHKMRNILAKLPRMMQAKMKGLVHQVFRAPSYGVAMTRGRDLVARFGDRDAAAMDCLARDLEECVTSLRVPDAHHKRLRTTNRLERLNGEGRRCTKVTPRFPTERSCLTLLHASLLAASKHWRGIPMTLAILRQLDQVRATIAPATTEDAVA